MIDVFTQNMIRHMVYASGAGLKTRNSGVSWVLGPIERLQVVAARALICFGSVRSIAVT